MVKTAPGYSLGAIDPDSEFINSTIELNSEMVPDFIRQPADGMISSIIVQEIRPRHVHNERYTPYCGSI